MRICQCYPDGDAGFFDLLDKRKCQSRGGVIGLAPSGRSEMVGTRAATYPHGSGMFVSLTSTEMILSPYRNFQIFALGNFSQLSLSYPRKPVSR